jgi:hypothetical protein
VIDAAAFFVYEIRDRRSSEIGAPLASVRRRRTIMKSAKILYPLAVWAYDSVSAEVVEVGAPESSDPKRPW